MLDANVLEHAPHPILANAIQEVLTLLVHGDQEDQAVEATETSLTDIIWIATFCLLD